MRRALTSSAPLLFTCAFLGVLLDFIFNGVLKIVWIWIYAPAYLTAATILVARLSKTRHKPVANEAAGLMILGALALHLLFTGAIRQSVYPMDLSLTEPVTFRSDLWPQRLIVLSDQLSKHLTGMPSTKALPVVIERIADYGCTRSSVVVSVAGVDVRVDPDARWTWKTDPLAAASFEGPGFEDRGLPWCRIRFYRGVN